jgi:hypothetical protein
MLGAILSAFAGQDFMGEVTIRRAIETDIPELSRLWYEKRTMQQQFDRRLTLAADGRAAWERSAMSWLADVSCAIFVGLGDGGLLGYVIGRVQLNPPGLLPEKIGVITDTALDAHQYQGGLGRSLVKAMRGWFAEQQIENVIVHVPHRHAVEQAFWRSLGALEWVDVMWLK